MRCTCIKDRWHNIIQEDPDCPVGAYVNIIMDLAVLEVTE